GSGNGEAGGRRGSSPCRNSSVPVQPTGQNARVLGTPGDESSWTRRRRRRSRGSYDDESEGRDGRLLEAGAVRVGIRESSEARAVGREPHREWGRVGRRERSGGVAPGKDDIHRLSERQAERVQPVDGRPVQKP